MKTFTTLLLALMVTGTACGGDANDNDGGAKPPTAATEPAVSLTGTSWVLQALLTAETETPASEASVRISEDGSFSGSAGCNSMNGTIAINGDQLDLVDLAITDIGCEPEPSEQAAAVLDVLDSDPTWTIEGSTLTLALPDGTGAQFHQATS